MWKIGEKARIKNPNSSFYKKKVKILSIHKNHVSLSIIGTNTGYDTELNHLEKIDEVWSVS